MKMILEGLGPKKKVFDDLDVGDYLFEVVEPGDKGWTITFTDKDEGGNETDATATYINWRFRVVEPEEFAGRNFFHLTMIHATDEKIAKAKRPYDPSGFTYQFLGKIGVGLLQAGEVTILDDFLSPDDSKHPCLDLNKVIGLTFWGSLRKVKGRDGQERVSLTEAWAEK
jgi:hypothetical protein